MAKIQGQIRLKSLERFLDLNGKTLDKWAEQAKCDKDNLLLNVTLEQPFRPRTTGYKSQNHALNGYIQQICKETGQDFATTKNFVKYMAIDMGYPIKKRRLPNGCYEDVTDWFGNPVGISEADASVQDCMLLIDCVVRLASDLGIILQIGDD